jgi:serine protease AprX
VAGIIAGNGYDSLFTATYPGVYRGIAPEANIISFRVLDSTGAGTDSYLISAMQEAIALQSTYNIRVINLSVARGIYESYSVDPLCQAVESAWNAGIVVVVAAGNMGEYYDAGTSGYATIGAPGNDPYVITVGATNTHGTGSQSSQTLTNGSQVTAGDIAEPKVAGARSVLASAAEASTAPAPMENMSCSIV